MGVERDLKVQRAWALVLAVALALMVAVTRLVPVDYRPYNFAAVGALALFTGARVGLWQALLISFVAMLASDSVLLWQNDFNAHYVPFASVYAAIAVYGLIGWFVVGGSENAFRIGFSALVGSTTFFLITNFASWLSPIHGYDRSVGGLIDAYAAGLPFIKGTLIGDFMYTALLFGAAAVLSRVLVPHAETVRCR